MDDSENVPRLYEFPCFCLMLLAGGYGWFSYTDLLSSLCIRVNRPNGLQYLRRQYLPSPGRRDTNDPQRINPETRSSIEDPKTVAKDQKQSELSKAVFKSHSNLF